jgi:hypothetical protein
MIQIERSAMERTIGANWDRNTSYCGGSDDVDATQTPQ